MIVVLVVVALILRARGPVSTAVQLDVAHRVYDTNDPVARACDLNERSLLRIWRGSVTGRSPDVVMVPQYPNYTGAFDLVNHSGPWDYLTHVPLVLYGPSVIPRVGDVNRPVDLVDVYPTIGDLLGVPLDNRDGAPLVEATSDAPRPKLVVTIVWDGAGANVLARWPDRWPFLASLARNGVSYTDASTGSSPTITPSTHANLGTGTYPRRHGVAGIYYRHADGTVGQAFDGIDASMMHVSTYADDVDRAFDNHSLVGLVGWRAWHLGMLGHGTGVVGADADQVALFRHEVVTDPEGTQFITGSDYELPRSLGTNEWSHLADYAARLDRSDGAVDEHWLGHPVLTPGFPDNPAWARDETDAIIRMLESEGYGQDSVPDLLFANFKMTDTVGHHYLLDSEEMGQVIKAQDEGLRRIVGWLDRAVGDYVVLVTADHGHTPPPRTTGAWPIMIGQLAADIDAHFDVPEDETLIDGNVGVGLFLDAAELTKLGVTESDVALFVNAYTVADNWASEDLPTDYADRGAEQVFAAAWPASEMDSVMKCRFGTATPPPDLHG